MGDGVLKQWNEANPDRAVAEGDFIEAATIDQSTEKVSGAGIEVLEAMATAQEAVRLHMLRKPVQDFAREEWTVQLTKPDGDTLGAKLAQSGAPHELAVQSIADSGAIPRWNEANPEKALAVNDIIVQVNEVAGTSRDMMNELKSSNAMVLRLVERFDIEPFSDFTTK